MLDTRTEQSRSRSRRMAMRLLVGVVVLIGGIVTGAAFGAGSGAITFSSGPGSGPAPSSLGPYSMQAFSSSGSGATVSAVTGPTGQVAVSPSMSDQAGAFANGTSNFLVSNGAVSQETLTMPPGTGAFYVYAGWECNCGGPPPSTVSITATAQDGTSSGPVPVALGAPAYFGFYAACGSSLQTVTLSVTGTPWTLTMGAFGIAPTSCSTTGTTGTGTAKKGASSTKVSCNYAFAALNDTCTAIVGSGTTVTPTGNVAFTASSGAGAFTAGKTCTLAPIPNSPSVADCSVTYVPPATGAPTITAAYGGDVNDAPSSGSTGALINQQQAVLIASGTISPQTLVPAPNGPPVTLARVFGAIVRFTLRAPAVVRFTVQRPLPGRKNKAGVCQRPSNSTAHRVRCTLLVTLPGSFTLTPHVGVNSFRFRGRIGGRTLRPGHYQLVGTPSIAGVAQKPVVIPFGVR
jgi:hypothetical protein